MKKIFLIFVSIFLSSCDLDKSMDNWEVDNDDTNVIDKIWKQSLDNAFELYDTNTRAS